MKKTLRILAGMLALVMILGLCGCKKKEATAEKLLASSPKLDPEKYHVIDLYLSADVTEEGATTKLAFGGVVEFNGHVTHIKDGKMKVESEDFSTEVAMDAWADIDNQVMYSNIRTAGEGDEWTKSTGEDSLEFDAGKLLDLSDVVNADLIDDGKGDYQVTWDLDKDSISGLLYDMTGLRSLESMGDMATEGPSELDFVATATARFDRKSWNLKSLEATVTLGPGWESSMTVVVSADVDKVNGKGKLGIPVDVIAAAES